MFIGREKELDALRAQFASSKKTAVLVYGKRRVGKTALIAQAAKSFEGVVVEHLCVQSTYGGNLELLYRSVAKALGLPSLKFDHIYDLFDFLKAQERPILMVIDEYQYLKESLRPGEVDSYMQVIVDALPPHVKLVLCGSYITVMRELLDEENPLFGRFSQILHLEEFDYLDASRFYPDVSVRERIALYAVFGGSPFVLCSIDPSRTAAENIIDYLLPATGILRTHIEHVMLKEIQKAFDVRILDVIGNGKKRYSQIQSALGTQNNGLLDKQLKNLIGMEMIQKTFPINREDNKRKHFYEIRDNLMRFYFSYVFANSASLARLGERAFFENEIAESLVHFVSRRLERIAQDYFSRQVKAGKLKGVTNIGSYWYDDPATRTNGEFDCVVMRRGALDVYECKYYEQPMRMDECELEQRQVRRIPELPIGRVGFVCTAGFDFDSSDFDLISGEDLYRL